MVEVEVIARGQFFEGLRHEDLAANGRVSFTVPAGTTVAALATLGADYKVVSGDCGGGSPRFSIRVDTNGDNVPDASIFVYIGPGLNYTGCPAGWQSTGNLLLLSVDTGQVGGTFYDTFANAIPLVGTKTVTHISLVADGSCVTDPQTFDFDNVNINGQIYTFEPPANKDSCKNDGWKTLFRVEGTPFKNQGDCIQYVNTGK